MGYRKRVPEVYQAGVTASIAFDEACSALDDLIIEKTDDHGECALCGAAMYYCMDHTHEDDCPISVVEKHHGLFQDALSVLDDEIAKKMIEAGRGDKLQAHPLETMERQMLADLQKSTAKT